MKWLLKHEGYNDFRKNKTKEKIDLKKAHHCSNIYPFLIFLSLIGLGLNFSIKRKEISKFSMNSLSNEITIKIQGIGNQQIISDNYTLCPDSIYLNDATENLINGAGDCKTINIASGESNINKVKLVWNSQLTSLHSMFSFMNNIIEVDLSNLDSSLVVDTADMFFNSSSIKIINLLNLNTASVVDMEAMFHNCFLLNELDLSSFITTKVTNMSYMFYGCHNLKNLNLSNFDTSEVELMDAMFYNLISLENLDINSFSTSKVTNMSFMFQNCNKLKSLDLSHFDTKNVISMIQMFALCTSLDFLDISNFDTSKVTTMRSMFYDCENLEVLNLSNFNTPNLANMAYIFSKCKALKYLNISNFDTSQVTDMYASFSFCESLKKLDLSNFNTPKVINMSSMFYECFSMSSLDVSNFNTENVKLMSQMFYNCRSLPSLDLSSFHTPKAEIMNFMFFNCCSMKTLNVSNFDTTQVTDMEKMFCLCKSLDYLDLSSFYTPKVKNMNYMFFNCESMKNLNVSNFDTTQVTIMDQMFCYCKSLNYLDLSSFYTPNVVNMNNMFYSCEKLASLNISNFNTTLITNMAQMFYNCKSLIYLDLSSFNTSNVKTMGLMFYDCQSLKSLDISNFDTSNVVYMNYMFWHCLSLASLNLDYDNSNENNLVESSRINRAKFRTNLVINMDSMLANCLSLTSLVLTSFDTSKVENMNYMVANCPKLSEIDLSIFNTSSLLQAASMFWFNTGVEYINLENYNEFNSIVVGQSLDYVRDNIVICIKENNDIRNFQVEINKKKCHTIYCGDNWRSKIKKIIPETGQCAENCFNYNYESDNKCYSVCPPGITCFQPNPENTDKIGSTNINSLTDNKNEEKDVDITLTQSNEKEDKISPSRDFSSSSPSNINEENLNYSNIRTSLIDKNSIEESDNNMVIFPSSIHTETIKNLQTYNITGENNEEIYQEIKEIINNYIAEEGEDITIEAKDNFFYKITTSDKEMNDIEGINQNTIPMTKIDLGECENLLKDYYLKNRNVSLIIVKFEKITNISSERILQYEVYEPFNKTKLDLSICDKTPIITYTPVVLSKELLNLYNEIKDSGYDLFNIESSFYKDICTPFTSSNGTDVSLADRKNHYFNNDEIMCQPNCKFSDYSIETKLLKCECDITNSEIETKVIKKEITKNTIYESFYDTLKFSNYKVLWCYKLAFHINSVTINKGSIIAIIFFLIYSIFLISYICKGIRELKLHFARSLFNRKKKSFEEILNEDNNMSDKQKENISSSDNNENQKTELKKSGFSNKYSDNFPPRKKSSFNKFPARNSRSSKQVKRNERVSIIAPKSSDKNVLVSNKLNSKNSFIETFEENSTKIYKNTINKKMSANIQNKNLDDYELNNLEYDLAIQIDKRPFLDIYWSLLKREHLIFFTFFVRNDYNLVYVKFSRLIFLICTDMTLNVFFFADETMHKMFIDYGKYNFVQQIPQIVISTVLSQIIEVFLCFLSMTDKHFYEIKHLKYENRYDVFRIIKNIKIKLTVYFIITFLLFAFYWYAIACFCAVYPNTQSAFIKDSLSSFALALLYPFILYIFPSILRILSLRASNSDLSCLYSMSDIIPFF